MNTPMINKIFRIIKRFCALLFLKRKMVKKLMVVSIAEPASKKRFSRILTTCCVPFRYTPL
jgi:hypothetical protein